jgi:hypothetical protein
MKWVGGWEHTKRNELNDKKKRGRNVLEGGVVPYLWQTVLTRRSAQPMFLASGLVKTLVIPATDSLLLVVATIEATSAGFPGRMISCTQSMLFCAR